MIHVLSLGAGVQSSFLTLAACKGLLPVKPAYAIFADTQFEPKAVYRNLAFLEDECNKSGIELVRITKGNIRQDTIDFRRQLDDTKRYAAVPFFIKNLDDKGTKLKRQCTSEYKIEIIEKCIKRRILKLRPRQRAPKYPIISQWLGISSDEGQRAKPPGKFSGMTKGFVKSKQGIWEAAEVKKWVPCLWKVHSFPLLNTVLYGNRHSEERKFFANPMNRQMCLDWLRENYPGRHFPRSACLFCPFRNNDEWREMRDNQPEDWAEAVRSDYQIREAVETARTKVNARRMALTGMPYIHRQMIPLDTVDFDGLGVQGSAGCGALDNGITGGLCGV